VGDPGGGEGSDPFGRAATRILLLDDAFSHLDEETESEIIGNLVEALPETTIVFTSHRISSLLRANRVVVLGDGRIIQEGDPLSLLEEGGYFRRIWQEQRLISELDRFDREDRG
jgi:ATP-binding cassette subfamily B multidrug efflux pump